MLLAPTSAGPGDLVLFALAGTAQGAQYTLTLRGGDVLARGEDTTPEPGVVGAFKMPDLGPHPRKLKLQLVVLDPAGSVSSDELSIRYVPAATAEPGSADPIPVTPGGPKAADSGLPLPVVPKAPLPTLLPRRTGASHRIRRPPRARRDGGAGARRLKTAARPAVSRAGRRLRPPGKPARQHRRPSAKPALLDQPVRSFHRIPPLAVHRPPAPRDTRVDLSNTSFSGVGWTVAWRFLAGAVAMLLLLSAGVGAVVRLRRRQRIAELEQALEQAPVEEGVGV